MNHRAYPEGGGVIIGTARQSINHVVCQQNNRVIGI